MNYRCLTNNPLVYNNNPLNIEFVEGTPLDLFKDIKVEIGKGYKLITHPLTSSLPPNENPYKTVFLSFESHNEVDLESLDIIDKAIRYTQTLMNNRGLPNWDDESLKDFQLVDMDLIKDLL